MAVSDTGFLPSSFIRKYYYVLIAGSVFLLSLITDWYLFWAQFLFFTTVIMVIDRLGKGIILRELISLHSIFVCLFMPVLGYTTYNSANRLARIWFRYMPVTEEQYFSYALPAMTAFVLILCWPISNSKVGDQDAGIFNAVQLAKDRLKKFPYISLYLIGIGTMFFFVTPALPESLRFVATLVFWSSFAGVLYLYFTENFRFKKVVLLLFTLFIFTNALQSGMFTIVAYMGITLFSFFFLGKKVPFWKKFLAFTVSIFLLILIQNVKSTYRQMTWRQGYAGNKMVLFGSLIAENWSKTSSFFAKDAFFPIYYRTNQGFNVGLVLRRFPDVQPHDNGVNQLRVLASAFVPRLFWPDKPEAGGRTNMKYYTGITIKSWSTNVGPLGEAYGSFGTTGGILFMAVLGFFIRWAYRRVFVLSKKIPLLIFWIPVMFYQITYSAESDTLQILNSLFKSVFFIWLLVKIIPHWFGIERRSNERKVRIINNNLQNTPVA